MAGQVLSRAPLNRGRQPRPQPAGQLWLAGLQFRQGRLDAGGAVQRLQSGAGQALQGRQGGEDFGAAVGQVVVGVGRCRPPI